MQLLKYPRTHHIQGSRLQPGDEDLNCVPFSAIKGRFIVIEEKLDGANSGISFNDDGELQLQSRGHFLTGGNRERHFNLFKTWANTHAAKLKEVLGTKYLAFGEWVYAKHTVFYDLLPHYWMEFDVFDRENNLFLSTQERAKLYGTTPIAPVPVLFSGRLTSYEQLTAMLGKSNYISENRQTKLQESCAQLGLDWLAVQKETDSSTDMEGLYIKVEEDAQVKERYKFVRSSFLTNVLASGSHWLNRPIIPNQLQEGVDLFAINR
jgi:hypothetical protein